MWTRGIRTTVPSCPALQPNALNTCRNSQLSSKARLSSLSPYNQGQSAFTSISRRTFASSPQSQLIHPPPSQEAAPFDINSNPYKARRQWPPDISKLSEKQQFRLERKYRRRAKLKYARPGWTKATKLMQSFAVVGVIVYAVFFMEMEGHGENPFQPLRTWIKGLFGDAFTKTERRRMIDEKKDIEAAVSTTGR